MFTSFLGRRQHVLDSVISLQRLHPEGSSTNDVSSLAAPSAPSGKAPLASLGSKLYDGDGYDAAVARALRSFVPRAGSSGSSSNNGSSSNMVALEDSCAFFLFFLSLL